jgi:hypothetical protein
VRWPGRGPLEPRGYVPFRDNNKTDGHLQSSAYIAKNNFFLSVRFPEMTISTLLKTSECRTIVAITHC